MRERMAKTLSELKMCDLEIGVKENEKLVRCYG